MTIGARQDAKLQRQKIQAKITALENAYKDEVSEAERMCNRGKQQLQVGLNKKRTALKEQYQPKRAALDEQLAPADREARHFQDELPKPKKHEAT